jgi:hypothetical protein
MVYAMLEIMKHYTVSFTVPPHVPLLVSYKLLRLLRLALASHPR